MILCVNIPNEMRVFCKDCLINMCIFLSVTRDCLCYFSKKFFKLEGLEKLLSRESTL